MKDIWNWLVMTCLAVLLGHSQPLPVAAAELNWQAMDVQEFFTQEQGTFLLRDLTTGENYVYNPERAATRFAPQSTFKIPNSLIGLQVKAVNDEFALKRWDGQVRFLADWNSDHTLISAMHYSVVWYYQELARDIGEARMQEWLTRCQYGNQDISSGIDRFWLSGSLQISPYEQMHFIDQLYHETLPFDHKVMKTVKRMMVLDADEGYTLAGKTGTRADNKQGWFVGFVENRGHAYAFVTQIDGGSGPRAKEITRLILSKYGLL